MNGPSEPLRTLSLGDDEQRVVFGVEDLCRHTLIFGSPGSGKATRAYHPLLAEMLGRLQAGGLIIATTAEAAREAVTLARRAGRRPIVIEPGSAIGIDLLTGIPEVDAASLRETLGDASVGDAALDVAEIRLKYAMDVLAASRAGAYSCESLTTYCFDDAYAAKIRVEATERLRALEHESDESWTIREALRYEDGRLAKLGVTALAEARVAISRLLEPLRDVRIVKTFGGEQRLIAVETTFAGTVLVLHVSRTRYERAARAIYTLAKRRLFVALERRRADDFASAERPVIFAVDDYAACVSSSDARSLAIAGDAGCMVLAATLGVSSLGAVVSSRTLEAVLQHFTQKIFFKTDDGATLAALRRATEHNAHPIEGTALFSMSRNQALCHVTVGDDSVDAVLTLEPLFVAPEDG